MSRSATRPSDTVAAQELEDLQDRLDEAKEVQRSALRRLAALEAAFTHILPAMQDAYRLTCTAQACAKALELYQGGAPHSPVADLQRAAVGTLAELRALLEANLGAPREPEPAEPDDTGPIVVTGSQAADAEGQRAMDAAADEEE
jgi:hypothetical protein